MKYTFFNFNTAIYHLKDLISGKKKIVKNENVKYIYVPQYETLSLDKIFSLIHGHKREVL